MSVGEDFYVCFSMDTSYLGGDDSDQDSFIRFDSNSMSLSLKKLIHWVNLIQLIK